MRVLAAPLDWGLGHATRLLPILRQLDANGAEIVVGVNVTTKAFLQSQMPHIVFEDVPSYKIMYAKNSLGFVAMIRLVPRIISAMRQERKAVKKLLEKYQADIIISDNRFGFRSPRVPSIIISHQLHLQYPKKYVVLGSLVRYVNRRWLKKFDGIWVPDLPNRQLSGSLSLSKYLEVLPVGFLSRFSQSQSPSPLTEAYVLGIVSGPEPLRSQFENILRKEAAQFKINIIIVGGKPHEKASTADKYVRYFSHLPDEALAAYVQHAQCVVSRSGYTSLMDYIALGCQRVFLVPTPGQTEQEYLATRLKSMQICDSSRQTDFSLQQVMQINWAQWKGFVAWQTTTAPNYYQLLSVYLSGSR